MKTIPKWRKSSFSATEGDCVEVVHIVADEALAVRDSKNPNGPTLAVNGAVFLAAVKTGKFDC